MRARHLSGASTPAGRVVAWVPTTRTRAAAATAPHDRRRMTADQLAHLAGAPQSEPGVPELAAWIGVSCTLPDTATTSCLPDRLAAIFARHESLRSVLEPPSPRHPLGRRRLVPAGDVEFEPVTLGHTTSSVESYDLVAAHLADQARCDTWPYAGFATIENADATTLFAAFDHVTFDGYSIFVLMDDLQATGDRTEQDVTVGSHVDFAEQEASFTERLGPNDPPLAAWARALDRRGRLPGLPAATGPSHRDTAKPHQLVSVPIADRLTAEHYVGLCRADEVNVGIGFIAAFAHAALSRQPDNRLDLLMCTHGRSQSEWQRSIGWFAGVAPLTIAPPPGCTLREAIRHTARNWSVAQAAGAARIPLAATRLGADIEPGLVLSYMDGRRTPGWERWAETDAQILLGHVPPSSQVHLWINLMPEGLILEARHPDTPELSNWLAGVINGMRDLITAAEPFDARVRRPTRTGRGRARPEPAAEPPTAAAPATLP